MKGISTFRLPVKKRIFLILAIALLVSLPACSLQSLLPAAAQAPSAVSTATSPALTETPANTPTPEITPTPAPLTSRDMLWLANPQDGNVRLIEPVTGSVAVIIPTGFQPESVAVGEEAAWALDRITDHVLRINLDDYSIETVIKIEQGETDCIAASDGYVWVGITERPQSKFLLPFEVYRPKGGVLRIDPATNAVDGYAEVGPVSTLSGHFGTLWALTREEPENKILRIVPDSLLAAEIHLSGTLDAELEDAFLVTQDSLWVYSSTYSKLYRASHAGRLYGEFYLGPHRPVSPAGFAEAGGLIWFATPWNSLVRVDPGQNKVLDETPFTQPVNRLAAQSGWVWAISDAEAVVTRISARDGQWVSQVEIGRKVPPTPVMSPTPVQRAYLPCEKAPYSRLEVGMYGRTQPEPALPQRLHKEAGKDSEQRGSILPGETVKILEGPVCADDWVWWKVETLSGRRVGWAAEGDLEEYWLFPFNP